MRVAFLLLIAWLVLHLRYLGIDLDFTILVLGVFTLECLRQVENVKLTGEMTKAHIRELRKELNVPLTNLTLEDSETLRVWLSRWIDYWRDDLPEAALWQLEQKLEENPFK